MIRYVDDDGEVKVKLSGFHKPTEIRERNKGPAISLKGIEEEIKKLLEDNDSSKAFFCLEVKTVLIVITAWEIISLWYYLGLIVLRYVADCEDVFEPLFSYSLIPGLIASVFLHPMGWLFLCYLPDNRVSVVCWGLAVHLLVTMVFIAGCITAYISSSYETLGVYVFISFLYLYINVLYNSLMSDLSGGKYDIFHSTARMIGRIFDYISSKL